MAYFQRHRAQDQEEYTRQFRPAPEKELPEESDAEEEEPFYDDGLDELNWEDGDPSEEPQEEEWSEEEQQEERKRKFRIAAGAGDLVAVLTGTAVILVLTALLISMIHFVSSDITQNFSIWATKF